MRYIQLRRALKTVTAEIDSGRLWLNTAFRQELGARIGITSLGVRARVGAAAILIGPDDRSRRGRIINRAYVHMCRNNGALPRAPLAI